MSAFWLGFEHAFFGFARLVGCFSSSPFNQNGVLKRPHEAEARIEKQKAPGFIGRIAPSDGDLLKHTAPY